MLKREFIRVCLVSFLFSVFIFFLFFENYFHFQKIRILKICLIWLLVYYFHKIKILKKCMIYWFLIFLNFWICLILYPLSPQLYFTRNGIFYSQRNKILLFLFSGCSCFYFHWFSVKIKTKNNQIKHPLIICTTI